MRPHLTLRAGLAVAGAGVGSVPALAAAAGAQPEPPSGTVRMQLDDSRLTHEERAAVRGRVESGLAGRPTVLEFRAAGGEWTPVARSTVADDGSYRLGGRLPRSGTLRVSLADPLAGAAPAASVLRSSERRVAVSPTVGVAAQRLHVRAGRRVSVAGAIRPGRSGLPVALQVRRRGTWATVDQARTAESGRYRLRERISGAMSGPARVVFAGTQDQAPARRSIGRVNVYRSTTASWYGPGLYGNPLGCGGTLSPGRLGVAHKTLPCGTRVTFRHHGRSVRVSVIDRGPFVAGREYDLTAATARRLGFSGHGALQATR